MANTMSISSDTQLLKLTGLRFSSNLRILESQKRAPEPIEVNAELRLGAQHLLPRDDDIGHVLDYRKVRQIVIGECTAEHVSLPETLIGKLANRLLELPFVLGVQVSIANLKFFDDCEVSIHVVAGKL